ncbi:MAG TPA: GNAT family N-acetyltransferase [Actinocrinis sp.]|nr:GNAT family N-acetyltransferase [Actinocrinis sp.]
MQDATAKTIELLPLTRKHAARVAAGEPAEQDDWAEGFPREDDSGPAAGVAAAPAEPAPFGVYLIVPLSHGRTVGSAGFYGPPDRFGQVTIGYGMVESDWGRGYGTAAVAGLVRICRAHGGVTAVNADTDRGNLASQRVLEKNGFVRVRTTDDHCFYRLALDA